MQKDVKSEHEEIRELLRRIAGSLQEDLDAALDHRLEVLAQGKTGREATADLLDPCFRELVRQALVLINVLRSLTVLQHALGILTQEQMDEVTESFAELGRASFTAVVSTHLRNALIDSLDH